MKVRELIEDLQSLDPELPVYVNITRDSYGEKEWQEADFALVETQARRDYSAPYNAPAAYTHFSVVTIS